MFDRAGEIRSLVAAGVKPDDPNAFLELSREVEVAAIAKDRKRSWIKTLEDAEEKAIRAHLLARGWEEVEKDRFRLAGEDRDALLALQKGTWLNIKRDVSWLTHQGAIDLDHGVYKGLSELARRDRIEAMFKQGHRRHHPDMEEDVLAECRRRRRQIDHLLKKYPDRISSTHDLSDALARVVPLALYKSYMKDFELDPSITHAPFRIQGGTQAISLYGWHNDEHAITYVLRESKSMSPLAQKAHTFYAMSMPPMWIEHVGPWKYYCRGKHWSH